MKDTIEVLREVTKEKRSADIKMAVLSFATNAKWITSGLVSPNDLYWDNLEVGGSTSLGDALSELDKVLSKFGWMPDDVKFKALIIIFVSDGSPTDDCIGVLKRINTNNEWYKMATKISVAVDDDADEEVLANICGNSEAVIQINDLSIYRLFCSITDDIFDDDYDWSDWD